MSLEIKWGTYNVATFSEKTRWEEVEIDIIHDSPWEEKYCGITINKEQAQQIINHLKRQFEL